MNSTLSAIVMFDWWLAHCDVSETELWVYKFDDFGAAPKANMVSNDLRFRLSVLVCFRLYQARTGVL